MTPGLNLELSVALVDEKEITELNRRFLERDCSTDVLAFPQLSSGEIDELSSAARGPAEPLGDIVLCVPVAERQAAERRSGPRDEIELLATHGLLHLLGYEDETQAGAARMAEMESELLGRNILEEIPGG